MGAGKDVPSADAEAPRRAQSGRAPVTTHGELSHVALELFFERGFEQTTLDDIVRSAGIGRRTFFRYFASKNDLPWGDFDALLADMRAHLAASAPDGPIMVTLRRAVVEFNRFPEEELAHHRQRMWLLLNVPALVAHATLRYAAWRQVIAEYVARRQGLPVDALRPQAIAWACLGLCLAAYERWLADDDADLLGLLEESFVRLEEAFQEDAP